MKNLKFLFLLLLIPFINIGEIEAQTFTHRGTVKLTRPITSGATDNILTINSGGIVGKSTIDLTALGAYGDVTKVGTPVDNQIGVWTGDGTLEGDAGFTFDVTNTMTLVHGRINVTADVFGTDWTGQLQGQGVIFTNAGDAIAGRFDSAGAQWTDASSNTVDIQPGTLSGNVVITLPDASGTLALELVGYIVTNLPVTATQGDQAYVTDATAPTYLGALTGGGAVVCPVFYNGSIWVSH